MLSMDEREKLKHSQLENLKHMNIFEQTADLTLLFQHTVITDCLVNLIYMHLVL